MSNTSLVVLNIYDTTAQHLHEFLSANAKVSTPDPAYELALELFESTPIGGHVIWINAEGVTLDELAQLEKKWLPIAGKAIMLLGSNETPIVTRSLQGLMAARRENAAFQAVVLTHQDSITKVMRLLKLDQQAAAPQAPKAPASSKITEPPKAVSASKVPAPTAAPLVAAAVAAVHIVETPALPPESLKPTQPSPQSQVENPNTATFSDAMAACMQIHGALGAALCDESNGMALAKIGGGGIDLDIAAAGNTEVVQHKMNTMAHLGLDDQIEDMLITLEKQYHLIRPLPNLRGLFLYLVLDKSKSNLAMARYKLREIESSIAI